MGFWRNIFNGSEPVTFDVPQFAVDSTSIPSQIFGLESYEDPVAVSPRIDRRSAMQVPAVKRCRDLIAGATGQLPLDYIGPDKRTVSWTLFEQPERNVPRSVTMARTFEDLLFEGVAWWRITEFGWHNYPLHVARLDPRSVTTRRDMKVYVKRNGESQGTAEEWVPDAQLIRFDSPNDALLTAGARAIRTALRLDAASANMVDGTPPVDYFTPAEGADPAEDEAVQEILDAWQVARRKRSTGYVPAALKYNISGWNPEQLQLADARQHAVLEIARTAGVDPEELGVSTTSRTYANQFDRRKAFLDFTLGGYLSAVQDRLSMADVSQRGYVARFNLDSFLRSDTKTRFEAYKVGIEVGALGKDEIRDLEDKPALTESQQPAPMPLPAPVQEEENADV